MARKFELLSHVKVLGESEDQLKIVGYASTADTDRVGDVIVPDAWTKGGLNNYQKNPIILLNHNYGKPIGKAVALEVDGRGLKITCEISKHSGEAWGLIKDGVLTTFSVGFMIKDADYSQATDGYIIKEAELLEVSVVSVPCNQDAVFQISKSLENAEQRKEFDKEVNALKGQQEGTQEVIASNPDGSPKTGAEASPEIKRMTPEEMQAMIEKASAAAIAAHVAATEKAAKAAAEAKAIEDAADVRATKAAEAATKSLEEKFMTSLEEKMSAKDADIAKILEENKAALEEKNLELQKMLDSKKSFTDRSGGGEDPFKNKELMEEADHAFILSKIKKVPFAETKFGKATLEKFNTHSTVTVGTDRLETTVGTNIERDIWNQLILAPLFREIKMNSAQMTFPIAPDAGYAEITTNTTASGTQPNGNMDQRGAGYGAPYQGITLTEMTLSTIKMIAKSYLGNETEEDSLIPIMPLIRDAMLRSHQRGVENMFLAGNSPDGVYTTGAANGLLNYAATNGRTLTTSASNTKLTSAALFGMRKLMGKYGLDPRDIVYVVSQQAYFELIEDPEFADLDIVGSQANKLTGEVGRLYGSQVIMCDEFAAPAPGKYFALALNRRNFVVPRLRGVTVESEYSVENQRQVLVTSQRLGFSEIIPNALSVVGLKYGA